MKRVVNILSREIAFALFLLFLSACTSPEEKASEYIENAQGLFAQGNLEKALVEYRNALQINQNLPDALYGLAQIYERRQQWPEAYAALRKIKELAPGHVDGRIMLAQLLISSNRIDQALVDAQDILELAPEDARSHALMATIHVLLENYADARRAVTRSLALDPGNSDAILARARIFFNEQDYEAALKALDQAIAREPDNLLPYLMQLRVYDAIGDRKAMENLYLALMARFPDDTSFRTALAQHYIADGNIGGAERMLLQIIETNPENVIDKLRLVAFKYQYRSIDDAIVQIDEYIESDPAEYAYRYLLGELHERNRSPEKAVTIYRRIIEDDGVQVQGLEARNKIASIELRRGNITKAIELVDEVLARDISNRNALLLRAEIQVAERKYDDAIINARTVLRDTPDSVSALELVGRAYAAKGLRELAIESFGKAINLNPASAVVANQLALQLVARGEYTRADEVLLHSVANGNRDLETIKLLTRVKLGLGQWDQVEILSKELEKVKGHEGFSQHMLGIAYLGKQDQQAGIEAFKRAHELVPGSMEPVAALVQTYVREGKPREAREFLESVIALDSDNVNAILLMARLNRLENDVTGTIEQYNRIIEIDPRNAAAYHRIAALHIGENRLAAAEAVIRQGLAALPDLPLLVFDLAAIQEMKGEVDKAIETYEAMLEKQPDLIVAKNNLVSLLNEYRGDAASHARARNIAAALKTSEVPEFRDTYAWSLVKAGVNLETAIEVLEGIVDEPVHTEVYSFHLGEAYRINGDTESAKVYLQKAIDLSKPGSRLAEQAGQSLNSLNK